MDETAVSLRTSETGQVLIGAGGGPEPLSRIREKDAPAEIPMRGDEIAHLFNYLK